MKLRILAFSCGLILCTQTAAAGNSTDLVELCERFLALPKGGEVTADYIQLKSSCAGYINSHVKMSKPEDGFCVPKGYNMDDLAQIYMAWVKKHPDRIRNSTTVTMTEALSRPIRVPNRAV